MKLLITSDIHENVSKWKDLVKVCQNEKPDVVAISGDLFPKYNGILSQLSWVDEFQKYMKKIKKNAKNIVLMLGNDDNQLLAPYMRLITIPSLEKPDLLWHYSADNVIEIEGYEFVGMPYVPDYPFGYKFWCHPEFKYNLRIDPMQFSEPLLVTKDNKFEVIDNYEAYMKKKEPIYDALNRLSKRVRNMNKSIWMIHAPPVNMGFDICLSGKRVGSSAVYKFIEEQQPFLTLHGHIHESPFNGGKWINTSGKTTCIQQGQWNNFCYVIMEIEDGIIKNVRHSELK
jgi:Icc-related predicted phosphoesterase